MTQVNKVEPAIATTTERAAEEKPDLPAGWREALIASWDKGENLPPVLPFGGPTPADEAAHRRFLEAVAALVWDREIARSRAEWKAIEPLVPAVQFLAEHLPSGSRMAGETFKAMREAARIPSDVMRKAFAWYGIEVVKDELGTAVVQHPPGEMWVPATADQYFLFMLAMDWSDGLYDIAVRADCTEPAWLKAALVDPEATTAAIAECRDYHLSQVAIRANWPANVYEYQRRYRINPTGGYANEAQPVPALRIVEALMAFIERYEQANGRWPSAAAVTAQLEKLGYPPSVTLPPTLDLAPKKEPKAKEPKLTAAQKEEEKLREACKDAVERMKDETKEGGAYSQKALREFARDRCGVKGDDKVLNAAIKRFFPDREPGTPEPAGGMWRDTDTDEYCVA